MNRLLSLGIALGASSATFLPAQAPTEGEVVLPAAAGWNAFLVHQSDGGIWYAHVDKAVPAYGANEILLCDDKGRCTVLSVYSGKWTAHSVNPDGQWLALSRPADVDPRVPGREVYVGGKGGNVHRVTLRPEPFGKFALESVEIAHAAGEEFHTVLAADLVRERPGDELLVFGITGAVYGLLPAAGDGNGHGDPRAFEFKRLAHVEGRVRDAVVLPGKDGAPPEVYGASRSGHVLRFRVRPGGLEHAPVLQEAMGLGRIARRPRGADDTRPEVLYVTRDDGVLLRLEAAADGWRREAIFAGMQGLRGVAAGRFHDDPAREAVAVYGYGKAVQIVSRAGAGPWQVETAFTGEDQGHWLAAGELDGRNGTDELVATGFGGRAVLLSRPAGYGLRGAAVDVSAPKPGAAPAAARGTRARPWRIAVKGSEEAVRELSPLNYQGGFETKTLVYETLVRIGSDGRIVPGLASAWRMEEGGRVVTFTLREGATFHDGMPVTAQDVAVHFRRWVGLPEHAWLRSNERIVRVEALGARELRITMDRPHALLPDLCAINPTAIRGPGALDREGRHVKPVGSGPFAFGEVRENGRVLRYLRHGAGPDPMPVDLVRLDKSAADDPLDALLRGEVDLVLGSWLVRVDPERAAALRADPRWQVLSAPGSSMTWLSFRHDQGPTADRALRRAVAAAIDRAALVQQVEHGFADPSTGWAAPSVRSWPQGTPPRRAGAPPRLDQPLRIAPPRAGVRGPNLADVVAAQLRASGIPAEVADESQAAPCDLRIEVTHGVPYDPYTTLVSRFTPPRNPRNAESPRFTSTDPRLVALVEKLSATPDEPAREAIHAEIQAFFDAEATIVPLYAPRRIAILPAGMAAPALDHDLYTLDARWLVEK
ncbi:MAG: hypothetical protein IT458_09040 [Planctomycetes bacterium]|nr:hypothetical protein [Planctomycetota bacterium]